MATPRKIDGNVMRQEAQRAIEANRKAREALRKVLENECGPRLTALYLAKAADRLGENLDALMEIERITRGGGT